MQSNLDTYQNMLNWFENNQGTKYFGVLYKGIDTEEINIENMI